MNIFYFMTIKFFKKNKKQTCLKKITRLTCSLFRNKTFKCLMCNDLSFNNLVTPVGQFSMEKNNPSLKVPTSFS